MTHLFRAAPSSPSSPGTLALFATLTVGCQDYDCHDTATCLIERDASAQTSSATEPTSAPPMATSSVDPEGTVPDSTSFPDSAPPVVTAPLTSEPTESTATSAPPRSAELPNGGACYEGSECASGFCVDHYCCDTSCTGVCAACNLSGLEGVCNAPDLDPACPVLTCPDDTECLTYATPVSHACVDLNSCLGTVDCEPTPANNGTTCQSGTGECNGEGECVVPNRKGLGETCSSADECGSDICSERTDGTKICCDSACDSVCQECSNAGRCDQTPADDSACGVIDCPNDTTCADYPADTTSDRCASFGQCKTTATICHPDAAAAGFDCGEERVCDGSGNCLDCPTTTASSRQCTTECPCAAGEGRCAANTDCKAGFVCALGTAVKYGFSGNTCLPTHCDNNIQDNNETSVDCGGECGCGATFDVQSNSVTLSGISSDGTVVSFVSGGTNSSYVWESDGRSSVLSSSHAARGISSDGTVIIGSGSAGPVRWVNRGQAELLLPANQFTSGNPLGLSFDGSVVVGEGYPSGGSGPVGFVWSNGTFSSYPTFAWFKDVSSDGELVLGFGTDTYARLWSRTSGESPISLPGGGTFYASGFGDMSSNGRFVVGGVQRPSGSAPMIWDRTAQTVTPLERLPGIDASPIPTTVDDNGLVLGEACRNCEGVYWSPADGYRPHRFVEFMATYGVELPAGVTLGAVRLVTSNGRTFAGDAFYGDFKRWRLRIK